MDFLIIEGILLPSMKLSGGEKLFISYLYNLKKAELGFFAGDDWIRGAFGIGDPPRMLRHLEELGYLQFGANKMFLHEDKFIKLQFFERERKRKKKKGGDI